MAQGKKQINWNNVCMSNTGKDVAAERALLNTTSLIIFKQKEKSHFKSFTFKKWKVKMYSNFSNILLVQTWAHVV